LPECFVSVKLENNEDTCATETSSNTVCIVLWFAVLVH
jgi:hypothetical protein